MSWFTNHVLKFTEHVLLKMSSSLTGIVMCQTLHEFKPAPQFVTGDGTPLGTPPAAYPATSPWDTDGSSPRFPRASRSRSPHRRSFQTVTPSGSQSPGPGSCARNSDSPNTPWIYMGNARTPPGYTTLLQNVTPPAGFLRLNPSALVRPSESVRY